MVHITLPEAAQWLDKTKFTLEYVEADIEASVSTLTLSKLAKQFPSEVLTWTNETNTPNLVRVVISMRYAAAVYRRQYAEVTERMPSYPQNLDKYATSILDDICSGTLDLIDVTAIPPAQQPSFYPTDSVDEDSQAKFRMGMVF